MARRRAPDGVTLQTVARAASVAVSTASKALNPHLDRCDLNPETRARVLAAANALGYRRDAQASVNARKRHRTVAMAWGRAAPRVDGVYERLAGTLAETLEQHGYRLTYTPVTTLDSWHTIQAGQRLDGVIAVEWIPEPVLEEMERLAYPVVLLNLATPRRLHQILADDRAGADSLVAYLADIGHRRIAYLPTDEQAGAPHYSAAERWAGLCEASTRRGLALERTAPNDIAGCVARCASSDGPSAVIVYQYSDIVPLYEHLKAAGLAIPQDVNVVSFQDVGWYRLMDPPVTAMAVPMMAMAERAVARLLTMVEPGAGRADPRCELMPAELRLRSSTAPPRARASKGFPKAGRRR